jgi:hypothetical protein
MNYIEELEQSAGITIQKFNVKGLAQPVYYKDCIEEMQRSNPKLLQKFTYLKQKFVDLYSDDERFNKHSSSKENIELAATSIALELCKSEMDVINQSAAKQNRWLRRLRIFYILCPPCREIPRLLLPTSVVGYADILQEAIVVGISVIEQLRSRRLRGGSKTIDESVNFQYVCREIDVNNEEDFQYAMAQVDLICQKLDLHYFVIDSHCFELASYSQPIIKSISNNNKYENIYTITGGSKRKNRRNSRKHKTKYTN